MRAMRRRHRLSAQLPLRRGRVRNFGERHSGQPRGAPGPLRRRAAVRQPAAAATEAALPLLSDPNIYVADFVRLKGPNASISRVSRLAVRPSRRTKEEAKRERKRATNIAAVTPSNKHDWPRRAAAAQWPNEREYAAGVNFFHSAATDEER